MVSRLHRRRTNPSFYTFITIIFEIGFRARTDFARELSVAIFLEGGKIEFPELKAD